MKSLENSGLISRRFGLIITLLVLFIFIIYLFKRAHGLELLLFYLISAILVFFSIFFIFFIDDTILNNMKLY